MTVFRGRQFLHTPGPTTMPDRVLRAMDRQPVDHRGPEFSAIAATCFDGLKQLFKTTHPVIPIPSAGHGAWEAALVNCCSPGDRILMAETGAFSDWWKDMAQSHGIEVMYLPGDWRHGVDPEAVYDALAADDAREIKAVAMVHNETATGVASRCAEVREAIDRADHPALFMVDTISSLASMDFRMDEWKVDVAVGGSQKGLMLPPGMAFTGVGPRALAAAQGARAQRNYFDWAAMLPDGKTIAFPCTPAVHLFYGLEASLGMLLEEGLDAVFARHARLAEATRCAVRTWGADGGIELLSADSREHSNSVSAVQLPKGHDADAVRQTCRSNFNVVLGGGLKRLAGRVIRIGHLGDLNEPMILGTLASIEAALRINKVPHRSGGVTAAIEYLSE